MIDISFLTSPEKVLIFSGMEFIDYQGKAFYTTLTEFINTIYTPETQIINWSRENRDKLASIIALYTHLRVIPYAVNEQNFGISVGFISPNNVLNFKDIDKYFSPDQSNIGLFFKEFKKRSLTGWCDLKTGMVEGDFKNVSFDLYVPEKMFFTENQLAKTNKKITVPELIAGAILHELGHAFFALYSVSSSMLEDLFFTRTAAEINKDENNDNKIKIALEFKKETGIDVVDEVRKTGKLTVVGFKDGLADRDYRRTLSLGATTVTPELLANVYAIRMGAGLTIGTIYTLWGKQDRKTALIKLTEISLFPALVKLGISPTVMLIIFSFRMSKILYKQLVNTSHETNYRTIKSILRDLIDIIRKEKNKENHKVVTELMEQALTLDKMANEMKPFLEGTAIQRILSGIVHGRDAKYIDLETYTAELNYNPLSLYVQFDH